MNNETPQTTLQQDAPTSPVFAPHINHIDELNQLRQVIDKVMKNVLPIIGALRKENADLKAKLAEAQKQQ